MTMPNHGSEEGRGVVPPIPKIMDAFLFVFYIWFFASKRGIKNTFLLFSFLLVICQTGTCVCAFVCKCMYGRVCM